MLIFPLHRARPLSRRAQSDLRHDRDTSSHDVTTAQQTADPQQDAQAQMQPQHRLRGVIGYHNSFKDPTESEDQEDILPPTYDSKLLSTRLRRTRSVESTCTSVAQVPAYDCSVFMQSVCDYKLEKENPFEFLAEQKWQSKFAVLAGTQLCIHEVRKPNPLALAANPTLPKELPGKLVKKYTLQHAEVGLAADHKKFILVPKSALVNLLSASATEHLMATEPHKFDRVYQYVIRVRVETHQLLLRFPTSTARNDWITAFSAAIDISQPLETRAEPKFVTLPRRRRRRAPASNLDAMRDDQMRIAREQFPHLVGASHAEEEAEPDTVHDVDDGRQADPGVPDQDDAEANNLTARLTPLPRRPSRPTAEGGAPQDIPATETPLAILNSFVPVDELEPAAAEEIPADFDELGKWAPHIPHDSNQEARIRRRCMPSLLYNSKRSGDFIICNGKRVRIDWQAQQLRPWPELPPPYADCPVLDPSAEGAISDDEIRFDDHLGPVSDLAKRSRFLGIRRATGTGPEELRVDTEATICRVADDTTSGSSDGSFTPAHGRIFARLPRLLRRITSRQGPHLKMTHGNKSYAGHTGKERSFGLQEEADLVDRVPSHASSIIGRDDNGSALRKVHSAMNDHSISTLDQHLNVARGHGY